MSNKAQRYRRVNASQNIATVAVSSLLLFFGFSGLEKIRAYISWVRPISKDAAELGFNSLVFLLFVIGILHLVFRFFEKQSQAEKAVASLAALANEIEDTITSRGNLILGEEQGKLDLIRTRYEAITESIPANSDNEFIRAKRDMAKKEEKKPKLRITPRQLFDTNEQERIVSSIILGSPTIVRVLEALRETGVTLYLGGGLIRNAVWDHLHGYTSPTPVDDVDVVYFDDANSEKRYDKDLDKRLSAVIPNVRWSAKNQARMHLVNGEDKYMSLDDAISHWPETATAIVVRLDSTGNLKFVAPFGFDDLLRLIVTNTPAFSQRLATIRRRIEGKKWLQVWPRLRVLLPEDPLAM
jgi:Uncharacterized protein conserved in bacteria